MLGHKRDTGKWAANISVHKRTIYLGSFACKHDAANAYNEAAIKYFGEFSRPNGNLQ